MKIEHLDNFPKLDSCKYKFLSYALKRENCILQITSAMKQFCRTIRNFASKECYILIYVFIDVLEVQKSSSKQVLWLETL